MISRLIKWLQKARIFLFAREFIAKTLIGSNLLLVNYQSPERARVIRLIKRIKRETDLLMNYNDAYHLHMAAEQTAKVKGDIAEVGVYRGGSARIICSVKGKKHLHLFDTFEGLPETGADDPIFHKGQFRAGIEGVKNYLKDFPNVHFYKGLFPSTAAPVAKKKFSLVNLDVDLYSSTMDCLKFFYPRMSRGGIIISDDYEKASGVKKAFTEFFSDKPEPVLEFSGNQCFVVKT